MKWRTLIWISYLIATCLIKSSSGRGVLTIWLLNYKNVKGRTYDGNCCDDAPFGSKTCPDQCDYVMRCIVTGLGRANDHVFLFHRPIKYDSNDISFDGESSKMSQLTVLFDEWPSSGNVKMDVFFYDYDDFDHTTVLVDWFETPLRRTVEKGERQMEVVRGSRQLDKTILEFKWTVHCFGMNDCLSPPPEWHKWPWHPEERTQLLFDSSKILAINTTHSATTWKPDLKTSTVKIYNQDKMIGWEETKHHWADNSIWLNQSPFLPFRPVRPNPRTTTEDREVLVDVQEHARIIDAEERQDLPAVRPTIPSSQVKKGPDHRKHRRKKTKRPKQKPQSSENRQKMKTLSLSNKNEKVELAGLNDLTTKTDESKNKFPQNKDTSAETDLIRTPIVVKNNFQKIEKESLEQSSHNSKRLMPMVPLEPFDQKNVIFDKNQNESKTDGTLSFENSEEKSIKDIIKETEIKAGAVHHRVKNPFLQEPYKTINEHRLEKFKILDKKTKSLLPRSTESPVAGVNTTPGSTSIEFQTIYENKNGIAGEHKSSKSTTETPNISVKKDEPLQGSTKGKITMITSSTSSDNMVSKTPKTTKLGDEVVTESFEYSDITSKERKTKTPLLSGKVTLAVNKNGESKAEQTFSVGTIDIADPNMVTMQLKTQNDIDQPLSESTSPVPQDVFKPMAMNIPVRLPPKRDRFSNKNSKAMENIKSPFSKPAKERNFTPVKIRTESTSSSRTTVMTQTTTPSSPNLNLNKKVIRQRRPTTRKWDYNYNWQEHYKDFVLPRQFVPRVRPPAAVWTQPPPLRGRQDIHFPRQHIGINQTGAKRYPKESLNKLLQERKNSDVDYGYYRDKHNEFIINHNKKIREEKRKNQLAAKEPKRTHKNTNHRRRRPKRPPLKSPFTPAQETSGNKKATGGKTTNGRGGKILIKSIENVSVGNSRGESDHQSPFTQPPSLESKRNNGNKVNPDDDDTNEKDKILAEPSSKDVSETTNIRRLKPDVKDPSVQKSPFTPPSTRHNIKQKVTTTKTRVPVNPAFLERQTRLPYRGSLVLGQGFTDWSEDLVTQKAPINPKAVVSLDDDHLHNSDHLMQKVPLPKGEKTWLKPSLASRDPHLVDPPVFSNSQKTSMPNIFFENDATVDKPNKQTFDLDIASFLSQPKVLVKEINGIAKNTNVMFNISQDSKDNSSLGNKLLISVEDLSSIHVKSSTASRLTPSSKKSKKIQSPFSSRTTIATITPTSNIKHVGVKNSKLKPSGLLSDVEVEILGIQSAKSAESTSSYPSKPTEGIKRNSHKKNILKQKNYHSQAVTKSIEVSSQIQVNAKTNNNNIKKITNKMKLRKTNMNSRRNSLKKNLSTVRNMNSRKHNLRKNQSTVRNSKIMSRKSNINPKNPKMNQFSVRKSNIKKGNGNQKKGKTRTLNTQNGKQNVIRSKLKPKLKSTSNSPSVEIKTISSHIPGNTTDQKPFTETLPNLEVALVTSKTKHELLNIKNVLQSLKPVRQSPFYPKRKGPANKRRKVTNQVRESPYSTSPNLMISRKSDPVHRMNTINSASEIISQRDTSSKISIFTTAASKSDIYHSPNRKPSTPEPPRLSNINVSRSTYQPLLSIAITPTKPSEQTHHVVNIPSPPHSEDVKTTGGPQIPGVISPDVYQDETDDIFTIKTPLAVLTPASHSQSTTTASYRHKNKFSKISTSLYQTNGQMVTQNKRKLSKNKLSATSVPKTTSFTRHKDPKRNRKIATSVFKPFTKPPETSSYSMPNMKTYSPATAGSDQAVSPPTEHRLFTPNQDQLFESFKILDDLSAIASKDIDSDSKLPDNPYQMSKELTKKIRKNGKSESTTDTFTDISNQNLATTPQTSAIFTISPLSTKYTTSPWPTRKSTTKWITHSPRAKIFNPFVTVSATNVESQRPRLNIEMDRRTTRGGLQKGGKVSRSSNVLVSSNSADSEKSVSDKDSDSVTEGKMNIFEFLPNAMKDIYFGKASDGQEKNKHSTHKIKTDMNGYNSDYRSHYYTSPTTKASHAVKSSFNEVPVTSSKGIHVVSFNGRTGKTTNRYQPQSLYPNEAILSSATTVGKEMEADDETPPITNKWISDNKEKHGSYVTMENNQRNYKYQTILNRKEINHLRDQQVDINPNENEVPNVDYQDSGKDKKFVNFLFRDKNTRTRTTTPQLMLSRRQPTTLKPVRLTTALRKIDPNRTKPRNKWHQLDLSSRVPSRWEQGRTTITQRTPSKHTLTDGVGNQVGISRGPIIQSSKETALPRVSTIPTQSKYYTNKRTKIQSTSSNYNTDLVSWKDATSTVTANNNDSKTGKVQNILTSKPIEEIAHKKTTEKVTRLFTKTYYNPATIKNHMTTRKQNPFDDKASIFSGIMTNGLTSKSYSKLSSSLDTSKPMSTKLSNSVESTTAGSTNGDNNHPKNKDLLSEINTTSNSKPTYGSTIKVTQVTTNSYETKINTLKMKNTVSPLQSESFQSTKSATVSSLDKLTTSFKHPKNIFSSSSQTNRGGTPTTDSARVDSHFFESDSNARKNESSIINKESKMNITSDIFRWIYDISKSIPKSLFSNKINPSENLTRIENTSTESSKVVKENLNLASDSSTFSPKLKSSTKRLDMVTSKNDSHEVHSELSTSQSSKSPGIHTSTDHSTESTISNINRGLFFGWNLGKGYSSSTTVLPKEGLNTTKSPKPNSGIISNLTSNPTEELSVSMPSSMKTPTSASTLSSTSSPASTKISISTSKTTFSTTITTRKTAKINSKKATITTESTTPASTLPTTLTTPKKLFLTLPPWLKLPDLLKPAKAYTTSSTTSSTTTTEKPTTTIKTTKKKTTSMAMTKKMLSTNRMTTTNRFPITRYDKPVTKKRNPVNITINRSPGANNGPRIIIPNGGLYIPSEGDMNTTDGFLDLGVAGSSGARNQRLHGRKMNFKTVFSRYWPAILGLTVGTVFLVAAVLTSVACRQQRLYIRRTGWTDMPQHVSEPPDTSEYSSAASLVSDATRSSISFR